MFELVKHQRTSGMLVTVVYLRGHAYWGEALRRLGVEVHDLGLRFYGDPRPALRLRQIISRTDFDLLHAHLPPAELYARFALLGLDSPPLIITKHNDERFSPGPGQRLLGRWIGCRAGHVIAISEAVRRYMTGPALGLDAGKFSTIYYGIDAAPFAAVRNAEIEAVRRVGARRECAGDRVRRAARGAEGSRHAAARLRLVRGAQRAGAAGLVGEGPLDARLRQRARELTISDRVVWAVPARISPR